MKKVSIVQAVKTNQGAGQVQVTTQTSWGSLLAGVAGALGAVAGGAAMFPIPQAQAVAGWAGGISFILGGIAAKIP